MIGELNSKVGVGGPGRYECHEEVLCQRVSGDWGPGHGPGRGQDRTDSAKWALGVTGCPRSFLFHGNTTITHNSNDSS